MDQREEGLLVVQVPVQVLLVSCCFVKSMSFIIWKFSMEARRWGGCGGEALLGGGTGVLVEVLHVVVLVVVLLGWLVHRQTGRGRHGCGCG